MSTFDFAFTWPIEVVFRDIDALGHVNHATYLSYFENVRTRYILQLLQTDHLNDLALIVAEANVRYLQPIHFGDQILAGIRVTHIGTKSLICEYALQRQTDAAIIATARTVLVWFDYQAQQSIPVPDHFRTAVGL